MVAQFFRLGDDDCFASGGAGGEPAYCGFLERRGHVHAFKVEGVDLLLFAVFVDFEVALLEALHQFAGLGVAGHDVGEHEFGVGLEREAALRRGGDLAGVLRGRRILGGDRRHGRSQERQQRRALRRVVGSNCSCVTLG